MKIDLWRVYPRGKVFRGGMPSEALTTPALLSQRERREEDRKRVFLRFFLFPSLPLGERG